MKGTWRVVQEERRVNAKVLRLRAWHDLGTNAEPVALKQRPTP